MRGRRQARRGEAAEGFRQRFGRTVIFFPGRWMGQERVGVRDEDKRLSSSRVRALVGMALQGQLLVRGPDLVRRAGRVCAGGPSMHRSGYNMHGGGREEKKGSRVKLKWGTGSRWLNDGQRAGRRAVIGAPSMRTAYGPSFARPSTTSEQAIIWWGREGEWLRFVGCR